MKVLAINGSPREEGNTYHALKMVGDEIEKGGIDFEILHIGHKMIHGCLACNKCVENKDEKCVIKTDDMNTWIQIVKGADGLVLGSPVYFSGIAGTMKSFLDRLFYVGRQYEHMFRHKVGAAVVAVRRSGGSMTFDSLNHYLNYSEMIIATSHYWNIIHGHKPGEVNQDTEGTGIMSVLGKKILWLLKMKEANGGTIDQPKKEEKESMNFIR